MSRMQGIRAHANGANFELMIDAGCEWYDYKGVASVHKTPEPMRVLQNLGGGKFLSVYTKKAQPDYQGVLRGGRSVVFEAKHSGTDEIQKRRVTKAQWEELDKRERLGALCFVLVSFRFNVFSMIPWALWKDMGNQVGRSHLKPSDEIVLDHRVRNSGGAIMFLDNIEEYV